MTEIFFEELKGGAHDRDYYSADAPWRQPVPVYYFLDPKDMNI